MKEFQDGLHEYDSEEDLSEGELEEYKNVDESFQEYISSMDEELKKTKVGPILPEGHEPDQIKMDKNLVENLIESFSAQEGLAGPVSNIMLSLNKPLPRKS